MTDPRIEAAARALCEAAGYGPDGDYITPINYPEMDVNWKVYKEDALIALSAADAAACVRVVPMPIPADRMEMAKNTLLCWKNGTLTDEDAIGMIVCGVAQTPAPETITIPEVRNDRPIPVKGGVDG